MQPSTSTHDEDIELEPLALSSSSSTRQDQSLLGFDSEPLLVSYPRAASSNEVEYTIGGLAAAFLFSLLPLHTQRLSQHAIEKIKKLSVVGAATKLKQRHLAYLQTDSGPGLTNAQLMLTNHDLKPVEHVRRQWGKFNFVGFWIADSFNINTWMIASSMISSNGLAWWHAWICIWIGYSIAAMFICMSGRIGAVYHISFPVIARSSFGIWGSLWPVFNRAAMACVWYGVQSWIGGNCVVLMIRAIWPSYYDLPNVIPSSGTNTRDFLGFFIFWTASLPAIWFPVHEIRHLFTVKAYVVPVASIAFLIWAIVRAKGIGPIVHQPATSSGSDLAWGIVGGIMSSIANFATLIVNNPDFSRFATKPSDALWSQLFTIPIGFAVTSLIGIIVSSSCTVIFGKSIWNPLDLLSQFLLDDASGADRFGVLIIAAAFVLAQLGTNIAANSVSAGTDLTALLPRYLNIRRGGYICALIGLCICPWNLLRTSNNFITYLSAYSVFLSSVAGCMLCDYYIVRKGHLSLEHLYSAQNSGPYFYSLGWSWRCYTAYICGIAINIVGFVDAIGTNGHMPMAAVYIYRVNFFAGLVVSMTVYYLMCRFFPVPAASAVWCEAPDETDRQFSVVYTDDMGDDEELSSGSERATADEFDKEAGVRERRTKLDPG